MSQTVLGSKRGLVPEQQVTLALRLVYPLEPGAGKGAGAIAQGWGLREGRAVLGLQSRCGRGRVGFTSEEVISPPSAQGVTGHPGSPPPAYDAG